MLGRDLADLMSLVDGWNNSHEAITVLNLYFTECALESQHFNNQSLKVQYTTIYKNHYSVLKNIIYSYIENDKDL